THILPPGQVAGQMLKQFRLVDLLGEGGMGQVYRAYDTRLHRPVAIKLLSPELTVNAGWKQRFLQEARAAARISHPAVAQIYDADESAGVTFIVMELVEGKTVRQLVLNRELDLLGAIDIAIQVAEGLARAHELGIVHRDIKPANVMRTKEGHVKILDFGLAKLVGPESGLGPAGTQQLIQSHVARTQSGMVLGTPAYMSPEQVRGLPVDCRTDVFALGVLLYEMATGRSPFHRENFMDSLHAAAFEDTPSMESPGIPIPKDLQRVVACCLQKRPEDRYPDARTVAGELRRIRRDTETGLAPKTTWRQRLLETWEELRELPPSRYVWYGLGLAGLVGVLYWSFAKIGPGGLIYLGLGSYYLYRHIRNRPHRIQEWFVRRVSKIPEVRLILFQDRQVQVVVDRPVAQLYGRLNQHLRTCNQKLYFGQPLTLTILHAVTAEQFHQLLASPGVQYVREAVVEKND
ncbi:MAG TPA: serine/threonine-protein kinase, partial [Bacillota bacterium]|nr:serine/threonine-protein kinase [Bacillota bacterium]